MVIHLAYWGIRTFGNLKFHSFNVDIKEYPRHCFSVSVPHKDNPNAKIKVSKSFLILTHKEGEEVIEAIREKIAADHLE